MTGSTGCRCWCIRVPSYPQLPQWTETVTFTSTAAPCLACGQWVRVPLAYCTCGHLELSHDLNAKGVRTACFHIDGPKGTHCPCKVFTERSGHAG
jgi:hypothetical protein